MKDVLDMYQWTPEPLPAMVNVWPAVVGRLTGYGESHYRWRFDYVCPHVVTAGRGTVQTEHGTYTVEPGDTFCLWPGMTFEYFEEPAQPWQFSWVHLSGSEMRAFGRACGFTPQRLCYRPPHPDRVITAFHRLHAYYATPVREVTQTLSLLFAVASAFQCHDNHAGGHTDDRALVAEAETAVKSLLQTGANVSEVARALRVSRKTLHRIFASELHTSPSAYLQQARLTLAQSLLAETDWSVSAVARAAGYSNAKYFMRVFRTATGMTPTAWRQGKRGRTAIRAGRDTRPGVRGA